MQIEHGRDLVVYLPQVHLPVKRSPAEQAKSLAIGATRPRWLTRGTLHLGFLCLLIVLVGMLSPRLNHHSATLLVIISVAALVATFAVFSLTTRRLAKRLPWLERSQAVADAVFLQLRRLGLPLLGFLFFFLWALVYIALWAVHPNAFTGLAAAPRFADFFYYSVSTALISPPGDIFATTRGARSATMIEMLTGFALLAAYLSSFVDWQRDLAPVLSTPAATLPPTQALAPQLTPKQAKRARKRKQP
jgi:hypothetical protein